MTRHGLSQVDRHGMGGIPAEVCLEVGVIIKVADQPHFNK